MIHLSRLCNAEYVRQTRTAHVSGRPYTPNRGGSFGADQNRPKKSGMEFPLFQLAENYAIYLQR
ncbi:hypothetical protein AWB76_06781 [Caballeronia temeraria]|uniref:Uncharacterized protein n=1 Tax=Caballeronia temeraria TaxID=1777137 RepID=A0A158DC16_9BURK|nr:hypothetical protein AWB76_06781 [Caballeronia temeraria]